MKHLMIPLDETPLSEKALAHAVSILEEGGQLTLVRVPAKAPNPKRRDQVNNEILKRDMAGHARSYLEDKAKELRRQGIRAGVQLLEGEPAAAIVRAANELKVDAIVIATHERQGINRWLQSSVTRKVLDKAKCDVIVVPSKENVPG